MLRFAGLIVWLTCSGTIESRGEEREGRDLFVDAVVGNDAADGRSPRPNGTSGPTKTIGRAVRLAQAGDTIHLAKAVYFESIDLTGRSGEPGRPLVIDGHGAVLDGSRPIVPTEWKEVAPGLYRNTSLYEMPLRKQKDWVWRWFMIFDGKVNRMGRCMKGENAPYKNPADLGPGEWTYQEQDEHAFYIRIDPAETPAEARVAIPWEVNGVSVHGANHDLVIRNITATRVINDGYNITPTIPGKSIHDVLFQNIASIECGDDGFSAHDDCTLEIDGFYATRNGTGLCTTGNAVNRRLHLTGNVGWELFFYESPLPGDVTQVISDSLIECGADNAFLAQGGKQQGARCFVKFRNVMITAPPNATERPHSRSIRIGERAHVDATALTSIGLSWNVGGLGLTLHDSVLAGGAACRISIANEATWSADHNLYDLGAITKNATTYTQSSFQTFRQSTGQDATSGWEPIDAEQMMRDRTPHRSNGKPVGADLGAVDALK